MELLLMMHIHLEMGRKLLSEEDHLQESNLYHLEQGRWNTLLIDKVLIKVSIQSLQTLIHTFQ